MPMAEAAGLTAGGGLQSHFETREIRLHGNVCSGLEVAIVAGRFQARAAKLGGHVFGGDIQPGRRGGAAL